MKNEDEVRDLSLDEVLSDIDSLVNGGVLKRSIVVVQHQNGEVETFEFPACSDHNKIT